MKQQDYIDLNKLLLLNASAVLHTWIPGGKLQGHEYVCGDIYGNPGRSFSVNINTGKWADFAEGQDLAGFDLISLYARIKGIKNSEAYRLLSEQYTNHNPISSSDNSKDRYKNPKKETKNLAEEYKFIPIPENEYPPEARKPTNIWSYRNKQGQILFYIYRYDLKDGRKIFCPWSYTDKGSWMKKAWKDPRPLYNLHLLEKRPKNPVLIVEGEKAADAANKIAGSIYNVITWPGGAKAINKVDWTPLKNKSILIWPDNDEAGITCAKDIAWELRDLCPEIKVLDVRHKKVAAKWDAYNALIEGFNWETFKDWAKPIATTDINSLNSPIYSEKQVENKENTPVSSGNTEKGNINPFFKIDEDSIQITEDQSYIYEALNIITAKSTGNPVGNVYNAAQFVEFIFNKNNSNNPMLWFDTFHQSIFTTWKSNEPRLWTDQDDLELTSFLQGKLGFASIDRKKITDAVTMVSHRYLKHEIIDWLKTLNWDKTPRIETFFTTYFGAKDTDYERAVSSNFLISMIARVFEPGCKVDNMVMIEGAQGLHKTTALEVLVGKDKVLDTSLKVTNNEFKRAIRGHWLIEMGELESLNGCGPGAIKQLVGASRDWDRNPYEVRGNTYRRECVFIGTTNTDNYLIDYTGARRFWPIKATAINKDKIAEDREQLFAEALHKYTMGESWWEVPDSAIVEQKQRNFIASDVVTEAVIDYLNNPIYTAETGHKLKDILSQIRESCGRDTTQAKVKQALTFLGYTKSGRKEQGGHFLWYKTEQ